MSLWTTIENAAAAEFGRRHYRGVLAWRWLRRAAGPLLVVAAAAALVWAFATWAVPAIADGGGAAVGWAPNIVPTLIIALVLLVAGAAGAIAWRVWGWHLEVYAPWLTGRIASGLGAVVVLAALAAAVWPR